MHLPGGTSCPGARTFLGDTGMVFAAKPLGLWPLLPCEHRHLTRWLGGQHLRPSLCLEVVLIPEAVQIFRPHNWSHV